MDSTTILTKTDFWDPIEKKCPLIMAKFKAWVDQYKKDVGWSTFIKPRPGYTGGAVGFQYYKLHDMPWAIQLGIFIQFTMSSDSPCYLVLDFRQIPNIAEEIEQHFEKCERRLKEIDGGK